MLLTTSRLISNKPKTIFWLKEVSADNRLYLSAADNRLQKCAADNQQINFQINQKVYFLFINMTLKYVLFAFVYCTVFDERILIN